MQALTAHQQPPASHKLTHTSFRESPPCRAKDHGAIDLSTTTEPPMGPQISPSLSLSFFRGTLQHVYAYICVCAHLGSMSDRVVLGSPVGFFSLLNVSLAYWRVRPSRVCFFVSFFSHLCLSFAVFVCRCSSFCVRTEQKLVKRWWIEKCDLYDRPQLGFEPGRLTRVWTLCDTASNIRACAIVCVCVLVFCTFAKESLQKREQNGKKRR